MSDVISALIVTLGLDGKKYFAGQEAVKKGLKETSAQANDTAKVVADTSKVVSESGANTAKTITNTAKTVKDTTKVIVDSGTSTTGSLDKVTEATKRTAKETKTGGETSTKAIVGTKNEAARTAKDMTAKGDVAAQYFGKIKSQALSLFAVLLGGKGIEAFAVSATRDLSNLGKAAKNIGMSVPDLSLFSNLIKTNGGSAEEAVASFQNLTNAMDLFKRGQADPLVAAALNQIHALPTDAPLEVFKKFTAYAEKNKAEPHLVSQVGQKLGFSGGVIDEARRGVEQVAKDFADALKEGVATQDMADKAGALQKAWMKVTISAEHLGDILLTKLAPGLTAILDAISAFMQKHPGLAGLGIGAAGIAASVGVPLVLAKVARTLLLPASKLAPEISLLARVLSPLAFLSRLSGPGSFIAAMWPSTTNEGEAEYLKAHPNSTQASGNPALDDLTQSGAPSAAERTSVLGAETSANGLPSGLIDGVYQAESSSGTNLSESSAGAKGHFQFTDATAKDYGLTDPMNFRQSAHAAASYLSNLMKKFGGDSDKALAGYNWGPGHVDDAIASAAQSGRDWHSYLPAETRNYLKKINPYLGAQYHQMLGAAGSRSQGNYASNTNTTTMAINGPITINTKATDGAGIVRDLHRQLASRTLAVQANSGLS